MEVAGGLLERGELLKLSREKKKAFSQIYPTNYLALDSVSSERNWVQVTQRIRGKLVTSGFQKPKFPKQNN